MGGFNLPPGCTTQDIENAFGDHMPAACEDCRFIDPKTDELICPFGDQYEFCPDVGIIKTCEFCKKPIGLVPGLIKFSTSFMCELYCCSQECLDKLKPELDRQIKEMMKDGA